MAGNPLGRRGCLRLVTSEFLPVGVLNDVASDLGISAGLAG